MLHYQHFWGKYFIRNFFNANKMLDIFYHFYGLNQKAFIYLNKILNIGYLPNILYYISEIFSIQNFAVIYILFCLYFYFQVKKSPQPNQYFSRIYQETVKIGTCYAMFGFTFAAIKFSVNLPRPYCSLPLDTFKTIEDLSNERCLSSFPSAHTGLAIIVSYFIWPHIKQHQKVLCALMILIVALSRITLAMHYPADIIYSALVSTFVIYLSKFLCNLLQVIIINPIEKIIFRLLF